MNICAPASGLAGLRSAKLAVGARQLSRAVRSGRALRVLLAQDADPALTDSLAALCREHGVPYEYTASMRALGDACGIEVGAAAAAVLTDL